MTAAVGFAHLPSDCTSGSYSMRVENHIVDDMTVFP